MMQNKINVLMCCSDLSVRGGMVSVVRNYLNYNNWENINIIYVPTHISANKVSLVFYYIKSYIKILNILKNEHIDIGYFHTAERGSFYRKALLVRLFKKHGIKTVLHHHAAEFEEFYSNLSDNRKSYVNSILELTDLNIVLSKSLMPMITNKAPNANVKVLHNAVKTYATNPYNKNAKNIMFLGLLGERKGVYDLLKAITLIDDKIPEYIHIYLCGNGEVEEVKNRIKSLNIEHRIDHVGWIDGKQKEEFINNSMINVLPSYNEGLPMTILETMAYGIPNISTNIAAIPEVIEHGKNSFMITPGDTEQLANLITKLCTDEVLRTNISQNAWNDVSVEFALENHIKVLKGYVAELLES